MTSAIIAAVERCHRARYVAIAAAVLAAILCGMALRSAALLSVDASVGMYRWAHAPVENTK